MKKQEKNKIKSFTDLKAWRKGHNLVINVYKITEKFPSRETYSLTDQMRRSATSTITSNIAEGFGRQTYKEKVQFFYQAKGSLTELKNQILIAKDVGYLQKKDFEKLVKLANATDQLLQGLIKKTKSLITHD